MGASCLCVILLVITLAEGQQCVYRRRGRTELFICGLDQTCCGDKCCSRDEAFYTLWYFWLAVVFLLLLCVAAVYWVRRNYIYHRLLASPLFRSELLAWSVRQGHHDTPDASKNAPTPCALPLSPPEYSPPTKPPAYTEIDMSRPPSYSSMHSEHKEKSPLVDAIE